MTGTTRARRRPWKLAEGELVQTPAGLGVVLNWRDNTAYDPAMIEVLLDGRARWFEYRSLSRPDPAGNSRRRS